MTRANNHPPTGAVNHLGSKLPKRPMLGPYGREMYALPRRLPRTFTRDASLSDPKLADLETYDPLFDGMGDFYDGFYIHGWMRDGESKRIVPGYRVDRSKITLPKV